jgi:glycerol-3-phosphate dehydrogenase
MNTNTTHRHDVIIIGGGLTGLPLERVAVPDRCHAIDERGEA